MLVDIPKCIVKIEKEIEPTVLLNNNFESVMSMQLEKFLWLKVVLNLSRNKPKIKNVNVVHGYVSGVSNDLYFLR